MITKKADSVRIGLRFFVSWFPWADSNTQREARDRLSPSNATYKFLDS